MTATLRARKGTLYSHDRTESDNRIEVTCLEGMPEKQKREENGFVFLPLNLSVALLLLCVAFDRVVDVVKDVVAGTNL